MTPTQMGEVTLSDAAVRVAWRLRRASLAPVRIAFMVAMADLFSLPIAIWFGMFAAPAAAGFVPLQSLWIAALVSVGSVLSIATLGGYNTVHLSRLLRALAIAIAGIGLSLIAMAMISGELGVLSVFWAFVFAGFLTTLQRLAVTKAIKWAVETGLTERRAVIVGGGYEAERLIRGLAQRAGNDVRIWGIFDDRNGKRSPDLVLDVPKIGKFDDLVEFCRRAEVDLIILTLPPESEERIGFLLSKFKVLPVPVHLSAYSKDFAFRDDPRGTASALLPASFRAERRLAKRCFDLFFGWIMLISLGPLMALIALAIRIDTKGPVFFRQMRHGFNDSPITVWKFRTMHHAMQDPGAEKVVTKGDLRVTRLGRILRKTSMDELPQLFNVISGTLSLVGPRPHALNARSSRQVKFDQIVEGYSARHRLPPGITGWAQINGWRGEVDDPENLRQRVAHDLFYIENWSLWFDIKILLRTPTSLLDTQRAY
ncbi:MAG: Undecaprenyl-phosphate glucose phosphotransferase [Paracoccaceae bacterium]|jgi:Undecaprenyl-phosphate glucose phosphotransferase